MKYATVGVGGAGLLAGFPPAIRCGATCGGHGRLLVNGIFANDLLQREPQCLQAYHLNLIFRRLRMGDFS
jgi:hypothetical protein